MLLLGTLIALIGVGIAVFGNPLWNWYYETILPGEKLVHALTGQLQQGLLVGGMFMVIGSILVKHSETLKGALRDAAVGERNRN